MAKKQKWLEIYDCMKVLGEGGNATVYLVEEKTTHNQYALKELYNSNSEKKTRFINEIDIASNNAASIPGIIPIIAANKDEYWYTMPIAQSIAEYIEQNKTSIKSIVEGFIQLAETLELLHQKGISHRDIKPSNIYFYNKRFSLGDFGLVDFPDNPDLTKSDKGLGAIFTIAPEMKRNPKHSDGKKADVYSLAKTLWMLLVDDDKGFDGVYNSTDKSIGLMYFEKLTGIHLVELEELIESSTSNDPQLRPTMSEFKNQLVKWIEIYSDYEKSQQSGWENLRKRIFGSNQVDSCCWRDVEKIIKILNIIGSISSFNHLLFSDGGGLDFTHAVRAAEEGCIAFFTDLGFCYIAKPKQLLYECFGGNHKWDYFLLEFDMLSKIIDNNADGLNYEYLVEDTPGHYVSAKYAQYGVYDYDSGIPLPDGFRVVRRYNKGKILIVLKNGYYNLIPATYDGRHGQCSSDEFRKYILKLSEQYATIYNLAKTDPQLKLLPENELERRLLSTSIFKSNPFHRISESVSTTEMSTDVEEYIENTYHEWDFKSLLPPMTDEGPISFSFIFSIHITTWPPSEKKKYLYEDGRIREADNPNGHQAYSCGNRECAVRIQSILQEKILEILAINGFEPKVYHSNYIDIEVSRAGTPNHLFSEQEIRDLMINADDRNNNQLVIDEYGYARIITDDSGDLYPVRLESWDAGKLYVGKYSSLDTLHDNYISCLQGWLLYLKTGKTQYNSYVHSIVSDETKLITMIEEYY